ncbi:MAG TPA: hypothetical protein H9663_00925 [Firmicutes bacterium]|nr:hypothetical protein [Bacillota bacterium]
MEKVCEKLWTSVEKWGKSAVYKGLKIVKSEKIERREMSYPQRFQQCGKIPERKSTNG